MILAIAVVVTHCGGTFYGIHLTPPAHVAVQAFFMISGFYMSLVLTGKYSGDSSSTWLFYTNRLARLVPVFWVFLSLKLITAALTLAFGGPVLPSAELKAFIDNAHRLQPTTFAALVLSNLVVFGQGLILFLGINAESGALFLTKSFSTAPIRTNDFMFLSPAWSLELEMLFYLFAPFILRLRARWITLMIVASLALRFYFFRHGFTRDPWTYRFFPFELAFFLLGALAHRVYRSIDWQRVPRPLPYALSAIIFFQTFGYHYYLPEVFLTPIPWLPLNTPQIIFYAGLFVLLPCLFQATKRMTFDRKVGELSYGVYLGHMIFIPFFPSGHVSDMFVVIAFSIALSWIVVKFVEEPIDRWRQSRLTRMQQPSRSQASVAASA